MCEKSRHGANSRESVKRSISGAKCESCLSVKIVIREPIFRESVKRSILGSPAFSIGGNIIHSSRLFFFFSFFCFWKNPIQKLEKFPPKNSKKNLIYNRKKPIFYMILLPSKVTKPKKDQILMRNKNPHS